MNISTKTRYGFRLMVYLGNNYASGEPIQLGSVAEKEELSLKYLEKIAQSLKNAGLVTVKRGARGGYNLSREARNITCLDMFIALEGSPSVVDCLEDGSCDREGSCSTAKVWKELTEVITKYLEEKTLEDIIIDNQNKKPMFYI